MAQMTIPVTQVSDETREVAITMFGKYVAKGGGSNVAKRTRIIELLAAILTATATGESVDVTKWFSTTGTSPLYNLVHRCLSQSLLRQHWHKVKITVLADCRQNRDGTVTGESGVSGKRPDEAPRRMSAFITPI